MALSAENTRRIKLHNVWSNDATLDLVMAGNSPIPAVTPKSSTVDISTADGVIDTSRSSGRLRFNPIVIPYTFTHAISRYDEHGSRRTIPEMNRLVKEHTSTVENWLFDPEDYDYNPAGQIIHFNNVVKFYDTGLCDPDTHEGYWLPNPRCTNFSVSKALSPDIWVVQYSVEITTDPYMYEYTATPRTFAMFSGPTTDGYGMDKVSARIFSKALNDSTIVTDTTQMRRNLWTNDNRTWILSNSASTISVHTSYDAIASWTFTPSVMPIYTGSIGVYMNFTVEYTYNGTAYRYRIDDITVTSGTFDIITSSKIATPKEMGITNQNGFTISAQITDLQGNLEELISATSGHIPLQFIWGVVKTFSTTDTSVAFMIIGHGPGNTFNRITDASGSTIYFDTIHFGDTFYLDNDEYNEFQMNASSYGFYTLESPDNARRVI